MTNVKDYKKEYKDLFCKTKPRHDNASDETVRVFRILSLLQIGISI